jgi:hypothetical protein
MWTKYVLPAAVILALGAWMALVLLFAPILPQTVRPLAATLAGLVAATAVVGLVKHRFRTALPTFGLVLVVVAVGWIRLSPSHDERWIPEFAHLPASNIDGDRVVIRNVRNFDWQSEDEFIERWEERNYSLERLERIDLIASYWAGEDIAHLIVSFGFEGGEQIAASIETRRRIGQEYSAVAGFFRNYDLAYVLADERDVVRLRTNIRGERVYLYRLRAPRDVVRRVFVEYLQTIDEIAREPRFYNTLTTNCTTEIRVAGVGAGLTIPLDWRLLLTGHTPEYLYDRGSVDLRLPFDELRRRSNIDTTARAADVDPLFSIRIRESVPDPLR